MVLSLRRFKGHFGSRSSLNFLEDEAKLASSLAGCAVDPADFKLISSIETPAKHYSTPVKLYHSKHIDTDHPVVIKLVHLDASSESWNANTPNSANNNSTSSLNALNASDIAYMEHIHDELSMLRGLRHVNLLPLLASFVVDCDLYIVLSAAQFGSLDMWRRPVGICETAIAFVLKDVLTALVYLHKQGIVHRAICGSHILINSVGTCLLTGLKYSTSMMRDGKLQPSIFDYPTNFSANLLNITAPEILRQNMRGYSTRSDIYSVGILCCELANGCVPFDEVESTEMLLDKLTGNFPRPLDSLCEEIQSFVPESLDSEMLEKYNAYKNRTFSQSFHHFTIEQCLVYDFMQRPTASDLLNSQFIKHHTKKCGRKLLELLQTGPSANRMPINNNPVSNPSSSHSSQESIVFQPKSQHVDLDFEWIW